MSKWRSIPNVEAADLADKLQALDWSWNTDAAPAVVERFGWHTVSSRPRRITLETGFGPDGGTIRAKNGQVTGIELRLTDFADAGENVEVAMAFDNIAAAISAKLGEPTGRVAGPLLQYRWAGAEATVVLQPSADSVWLHLVTNARLAADDRNIALDEQGLL
ncbi:DUF6301 family protein [Nocardia sp. NPDC055049]